MTWSNQNKSSVILRQIPLCANFLSAEKPQNFGTYFQFFAQKNFTLTKILVRNQSAKWLNYKVAFCGRVYGKRRRSLRDVGGWEWSLPHGRDGPVKYRRRKTQGVLWICWRHKGICPLCSAGQNCSSRFLLAPVLAGPHPQSSPPTRYSFLPLKL